MNFGLGKRRLLDDYLGNAIWVPRRFVCPACLTAPQGESRATSTQRTAFLTGIDNHRACRWGDRAKSILAEDMIPGKYLLTDPILEQYDISSIVDESVYVGTGNSRAVYLPLLAP